MYFPRRLLRIIRSIARERHLIITKGIVGPLRVVGLSRVPEVARSKLAPCLDFVQSSVAELCTNRRLGRLCMRNCIRSRNERPHTECNDLSIESESLRVSRFATEGRAANFGAGIIPIADFVTRTRYYYRDDWIGRIADTALTIADEL